MSEEYVIDVEGMTKRFGEHTVRQVGYMTQWFSFYEDLSIALFAALMLTIGIKRYRQMLD
jgi:hypothetical protein